MELWVEWAAEKKASDLHLSSGLPPMVRFCGDLMPIPDQPMLDAKTVLDVIYGIMDDNQKNEFEKTLDIDFAVQIKNRIRCRVNVFHERNGLAMACRIIPSEIMTLEQLDVPSIVATLLDSSNGLLLVTGSSGSGKSTTLAAMVAYINAHRACHIITIEDPIEYVHVSQKSIIHQREVHRDTKRFSSALRAALREDPDVILVGELRDIETIRLALTAAETGHLVLATLHTRSAPQAVNRIIDVFPGNEKNRIRSLLSESIQGVICQTLIKDPVHGRVAAFEIMRATPAIRHLIREDKVAQMQMAMQTGKEHGMCTMEQALKNKQPLEHRV